MNGCLATQFQSSIAERENGTKSGRLAFEPGYNIKSDIVTLSDWIHGSYAYIMGQNEIFLNLWIYKSAIMNCRFQIIETRWKLKCLAKRTLRVYVVYTHTQQRQLYNYYFWRCPYRHWIFTDFACKTSFIATSVTARGNMSRLFRKTVRSQWMMFFIIFLSDGRDGFHQVKNHSE